MVVPGALGRSHDPSCPMPVALRRPRADRGLPRRAAERSPGVAPADASTIETLVAEDDWVAHNVRHQGTHEGEFEGVAPTGKRVEFRTMVFNRFADGIVVEKLGVARPRKRPGAAPRRVVRHGQALLRLVRVGSGRRFSFHVHPNVLRVQLQPEGVRDSRRLLAGSSARSRVAHRTTKGLV